MTTTVDWQDRFQATVNKDNTNLPGTIFDTTIQTLFGAICDAGREVKSRNGTAIRIKNVTTTVPATQCYHRWIERKDNLLAKIVETIWIMSGNKCVAPLLPYIPRALDYCDNETTMIWRGSYGPRVMKYMEKLVTLLKREPDGRRATINIYDSDLDLNVVSKDIPCNIALVFNTGEGNSLDVSVMIRSNDLIWGLSGINMFEWAGLLSYICGRLKRPTGNVAVFSVDLHVYPDVLGKKRVEKFRGSKTYYDDLPINPFAYFYGAGAEMGHSDLLQDDGLSECMRLLILDPNQANLNTIYEFYCEIAVSLGDFRASEVKEMEPFGWTLDALDNWLTAWADLHDLHYKGLNYISTEHKQIRDCVEMVGRNAKVLYDRLQK